MTGNSGFAPLIDPRILERRLLVCASSNDADASFPDSSRHEKASA